MKTVNVTLKKKTGPDVVVAVPAVIVGAFAVHHNIDGVGEDGEAKLRKGWTVTHVKTGLSACRDVCYRVSAIAVAKALMGVPGMDWSADDVPAKCGDPVLGKACLEAISQHRFA